jgi:DNA-dependent RNA polymerase auxiliary subunit epsilon
VRKLFKFVIGSVVIISTVGLLLGCVKNSEAVDQSLKQKSEGSSVNNGQNGVQIGTIINSTEMPVEIKVDVAGKIIREETESLSVDIQIPVINGNIDKTIETKLNTIFETDALKLSTSLEKDAKAALEDSKSYDIEFRKYIAASSYKVYYNKNQFLSLVVTHYLYTGGAHGMSYMKGYNIDLKTGKDYALSEVFPQGYDYKRIIDEVVLKEMENGREKYFEEAITNFNGIAKEHPFYIEEDSLIVYFGEYEIAPYAAGKPEFRIPFSKLEFIDSVGIE